MYIEKRADCLEVISYIDFDDKIYFYGMPYVHLLAYKENTKYGWNAYEIGIAVLDRDDYDVGLIYKTDNENFFTVLHELINWMRDHEQGISLHEQLLNPYEFFPDCGCERISW